MAGARSEKLKMTRVYDRLGKLYGKRRRINNGTLFEQLIVTILASESKESQAFRALTLLQERYVDWNEVRICPEEMLGEDLRKAGVNSDAPALLKKALEGLLLEFCTLEPNILDGITPNQFGAVLDKIKLPKSVSASLLLTQRPLPEQMNVPIDRGVARVMSRTGFVNTARATNQIKHSIRALLPVPEEHNFHRVVGRLSRDYCHTGDPYCVRCPIRLDCEQFKVDSSAMRKPMPRVRQTGAPRRSRPPSAKR